MASPVRREVVVTGVGAMTPSGTSAAAAWQSIVRGQSAIRRITRFDTSDLAVQIGGEVRDFDAEDFVPRADVRRLDRHALFAIAAGTEAMASATDPQGLAVFEPTRFQVLAGTGSGAVELIQEATRALDTNGPRRVRPGVVVTGGPDGAAAYLSLMYGAQGTSTGVSATCASGALAMGEALRTIRHGYADAVLVVGADACVNRVNFAANANIRSLTSAHNETPETGSRPFDKNRSGFVMSEGAAAVLLESREHASARGATVFGELRGFGSSSDAHHVTAPHPEGRGAAQAMSAAIADAGLGGSGSGLADIDHISAHGTSTPQGDAAEVAAMEAVFGERAASIPITAIKSSTGHLLGAAGVLEAIAALQTMHEGLIPPTINLDEPEFDGLDIVANEARRARVRTVLSNSFGFGGHNVSLVFAAA